MSTQPAMEPTLSVSEIASQAGVAASAVRFYEKHGLVAAERTSGNQRRFLPGAACRIQVARVAQRVGLSVREIAEILDDLPQDPGPDDWHDVSEALISEARRRIADLEASLAMLGSDARLCEIDPAT